MLSDIRQRVEEGVRAQLPSRLIDAMKKRHAKRNWRDCDCTYCQQKRLAHSHLQFTPWPMSRQQREDWRGRETELQRRSLSKLFEL